MPTVIAWLALLTVSVPVPLLPAKFASPPNVAPTAFAYVPALMPTRLTPESVATPLESVVAFPTDVLLSVKLTIFPLTGELPELNVATNVPVPL